MGIDVTSYYLRPAQAADVDGIKACVDAAYSPYIERIGRKPGAYRPKARADA